MLSEGAAGYFGLRLTTIAATPDRRRRRPVGGGGVRPQLHHFNAGTLVTGLEYTAGAELDTFLPRLATATYRGVRAFAKTGADMRASAVSEYQGLESSTVSRDAQAGLPSLKRATESAPVPGRGGGVDYDQIMNRHRESDDETEILNNTPKQSLSDASSSDEPNPDPRARRWKDTLSDSYPNPTGASRGSVASGSAQDEQMLTLLDENLD